MTVSLKLNETKRRMVYVSLKRTETDTVYIQHCSELIAGTPRYQMQSVWRWLHQYSSGSSHLLSRDKLSHFENSSWETSSSESLSVISFSIKESRRVASCRRFCEVSWRSASTSISIILYSSHRFSTPSLAASIQSGLCAHFFSIHFHLYRG